MSESCFAGKPVALFCKRLALISAFFLAAASWRAEVLAQSATLRLSWTDTSTNEDGFKIERLVAGLVDATVTVPVNATSYIDSALVAGTVYCYRVESFNSAGDSDPSNQACAMAEASVVPSITSTTVAASPTTIKPGGTIATSWSGITAPAPKDWVGLYAPGTADTNFIKWIYVSCSTTPNSAQASGSCPFVLPSTLSLGNYELRLFANDGFGRLATSNTLTVSNTTLTVSPTTAKAGSTVNATWAEINAPMPLDWIGLYAPGAVDTAFINWIYVSCSSVAGTARASGSCSYPLPATLVAGNYELRLFANDGFTRLASTSSFTVTTGTTTSPTLTVSPNTAKAGSTVTATWSGITASAPKDWIGLYVPGAADTSFINWIYVSCSSVAGTARASGSCSYLLPATLASGNYEMRLFANDGFTRLATSNPLTVSTSSTTPVVLANVTNVGNGSNTSSLPQPPREWSDYNVKVNLQSLNNNSIGVMFRYQDDRNHYRFIWNQKSKFRRLEKIENGTATVLAKDTVGYVKGRTYQLQIIAQGSTLRLFIDGAQIFSVADSTFAEGTVGLYAFTNQASFDNILVQDLVTGALLLSDDFNDGSFNGWAIVDQGTNRGPSVWSATSGALVQTSNIDGTFALYTLRNWKDYRLTLKMQSQDRDSIGVMFRYQDNDNYYRFSWSRGSNFRRLEKRLNGVFTVLAEDMKTYVTGQTYPLEIVATGTTLGITIDGTSVFSVADSSFNAGTIALYSNFNEGSRFDDVLVQDLASGATLLSDDFNDGAFKGWTIVDEGTDQRPSAWSVQNGSFVQSSNIGSNGTGNLGTYALY